MFSILLAALLYPVPPQASPQAQPDSARQQKLEEAREKYEPTRQAAIHLNELAGNIHSEADAREFIDAVAARFTGQEHQSWTTRGIRHQVAHAEYEAVADPSRLIPEQRIVDLWTNTFGNSMRPKKPWSQSPKCTTCETQCTPAARRCGTGKASCNSFGQFQTSTP